MRHPLASLAPEKRKPLFFIFLALTLLIFAIFRVLDEPLRTPAAPNGIVSFELAGSPGAAGEMVNSWSEYERLLAAFGLGFDYLFMPIYALALSLGILLAASRHGGAFAKVGAWLGWGALIAPLFDAVENFSLFNLLLSQLFLVSQGFSSLPELAFWCASVKFTLLIVGLLFALVAWLWPRAG